MRVTALVIALVMSGQAVAEKASEQLAFQCKFSLMVSQIPQQFSAPTPVEIRFTKNGKVIDQVKVIDTGGILFPGGNMKMAEANGIVKLKAVAMPPERPGVWKGSVKKDRYNFDLETTGQPDAVHFILTTEAKNANGEHVVIWNAANQPEGMPRPLTGTGVGYCLPAPLEKPSK